MGWTKPRSGAAGARRSRAAEGGRNQTRCTRATGPRKEGTIWVRVDPATETTKDVKNENLPVPGEHDAA